MTILLLRKLWKAVPLTLFAAYFLVSGLINLLDLLPGVSHSVIETISVFYNLLDMPLVLAILSLSTGVPGIRKATRVALVIYMVAAIIICAVQGLNYDALKYSLLLGLVLVLTMLVWEVIMHLQQVRHTPMQKGLVLVHAALLFQYGTYVIIYIFDYFLIAVSNTTDNFIIYYISSIISLIVASLGYLNLPGALHPSPVLSDRSE